MASHGSTEVVTAAKQTLRNLSRDSSCLSTSSPNNLFLCRILLPFANPSRTLPSSLSKNSHQPPTSPEPQSVSGGGFRGHGDMGFHGDRKCDYCGGNNHTEPYCWQKYGKSSYAHHVTASTPLQSQLPQFLLIRWLILLVPMMHSPLSLATLWRYYPLLILLSFTATLTNLDTIACAALSPPS